MAQTLAERFALKERLAGSFFFLRGAGDRSRMGGLIPTLAYQISTSIPPTKSLIERVLREDPTILESSSSIAHQFQKLIIDPLRSVSSLELQIFVIDGLDECDDKSQMAAFIETLIDAVENCRLPFRILLTSRVEEHIRKVFNHPKAHSVLYHLDLGKFDAHRDIQVYLEREFGIIYEQNLPVMRWIPQPWPSMEALSFLLDKTGSSFMFAATLIQVVKGGTLPDRVLNHVLQGGATGLDPLYKQVLSAAPRSLNFHRIIATLMILRQNQSITALSSLLHLQPQAIVHDLLAVQSIVKIPGDDNEPVMLYHTTVLIRP